MTSEIKPRIVYQIVRTDKPNDGTDVYVGSTSLSLKKRLQYHKHSTKVGNTKLSKRMFEVGVDNWQILPLLVHICDGKTIREYERNWVELLKPDLNIISPIDTDNKWHHNERKEYKKNHYLNSIETKRHYCDICDKAFGKLDNLRRHLKSSKHFYAYIYSVD